MIRSTAPAARRSAGSTSFTISFGPRSAAATQGRSLRGGRFMKWDEMPTSSIPRQAGFSRLARNWSSRPPTCTRPAHRHKAHVEFGFKFHPKGYQPKKRIRGLDITATLDLDIKGMQADQRIEAYSTLTENTKITVFEPHMHAAGVQNVSRRDLGDHRPDAQLRRIQSQLGQDLHLRRRCGAAAAERHDLARHRLFR